MPYLRPTNEVPLTPEEKKVLLNEYFDFYQGIARTDIEKLNSKIPRDAFSELLD